MAESGTSLAEHSYFSTTVRKLEPRAARGTMCFALHCIHYQTKAFRDRGITFHRFPSKDRRPEVYAEWVKNCQRSREPGRHSLLCSVHFVEACFDRTGQTVRLRENAIPTLATLPKKMQKPGKELFEISTTPFYCNPNDPVPEEASGASESFVITSVRGGIKEEPVDQELLPPMNSKDSIKADHPYAFNTATAKARIASLEARVERLLKDRRNAMLRERRAKRPARL